MGSNDRVWKSLATEATRSQGLQTRDMNTEEKLWLSQTLRAVHDAYDRKDINHARTLSHLIVSEGYRKQGTPQVWTRASFFQNPLQQMVNQQNQMLQNLHYQNQVALQQAMLEQPTVYHVQHPLMGFQSLSIQSSTPEIVASTPPPIVRQPSRPQQARLDTLESGLVDDGFRQPSLSIGSYAKPILTRGTPGVFGTRQNSSNSRSTLPPLRRANPFGGARQNSTDISEPKTSRQPSTATIPEDGESSSYGEFTIGDAVIRKNQPCTLVNIDFSTTPPDAIIRMANGRQIVTEFDQLSKPAAKTYEGFTEGDKVVRKGQVCTLTEIDFSMEPPGAVVVTEKGTEVSTEFHLLSKHKDTEE